MAQLVFGDILLRPLPLGDMGQSPWYCNVPYSESPAAGRILRAPSPGGTSRPHGHRRQALSQHSEQLCCLTYRNTEAHNGCVTSWRTRNWVP